MSFAPDGLASLYDKKGSWAYAVRELDRPQTDVLVSGEFKSNGLGYFGWLCGDSSTGRYYGAVPETDGSLVFIDGGKAGVQPLERYDELSAPTPDNATTTMGLECFIDGDTIWLAAYLDGALVGLHDDEVGDMHRIDVVGAYGEALEPDFTMSLGRADAYGSGGLTGALTFADAALLDAAPVEFRDGCGVRPRTPEQPLTSLRCYLQDEGDGAEIADFARYDAATLDDAFAREMATPGQPAACASSAAQSTWSEAAGSGKVGCRQLSVGIELVWTNDRTGVLGALVDLEGDYELTDAQWQQAMAKIS
jgi:hypothetical protein